VAAALKGEGLEEVKVVLHFLLRWPRLKFFAEPQPSF
jgi:hypothetical protein